jgi:hypothetical protein
MAGVIYDLLGGTIGTEGTYCAFGHSCFSKTAMFYNDTFATF